MDLTLKIKVRVTSYRTLLRPLCDHTWFKFEIKFKTSQKLSSSQGITQTEPKTISRTIKQHLRLKETALIRNIVCLSKITSLTE